MATAQCTYAIIHMYMYARRREADHTRCQRTYVLVLSLATPRTQAHSPKGGRLQCMYADASEYVHVVTYFIRRSNQHGFAMQRACMHCMQLTAPQHTAVALVNFCNAVLAARASLKRFTLEFVHALDYTNWIKPIF